MSETGTTTSGSASRTSRSRWRLVTVAVSLIVLVSVWQVFPFRFDASDIDWTLIVRVVLGVSISGCAIAIVVLLVEVARGTPLASRKKTPRRPE